MQDIVICWTHSILNIWFAKLFQVLNIIYAFQICEISEFSPLFEIKYQFVYFYNLLRWLLGGKKLHWNWMKKEVNNLKFPPFGSLSCNSCILKLCIFLKGIFLRNVLKKNIKHRWKISSLCTNNRSIDFCTLGSLVKNRLQYSKINTKLYSVPRIIVLKIQKWSHKNHSVYRQTTTSP